MAKPADLRWFFLLFLFSVFSTLLAAQSGSLGNIAGLLRDTHGEFPKGRLLVTLQSHGAAMLSTYADDEGRFSFVSIPPNVYHVIINDEQYLPVDEPVLVNPSIMASTIIAITLTPRPPAKPDVSKPAISGGNPNLGSVAEYSAHYPKEAIKEFDKGRKAQNSGHAGDAIGHYNQAIKLAPDFYAAYNNLGSTYLGQSNFAAAQQQFEQVIRMNQSDSEAYFNLGNVYLLTRRYADAERVIQDGLDRDPGSALGEFLLGSVYCRTGHMPEAEKKLHNALQFDPKLTKAHLELVNLYLQEQKPDQAIAELKTFLKDAPHDPFAPKAAEVLKRLEQVKTQALPPK